MVRFISRKDYLHLLGEEGSKELRRRLDDSLHVVPHPSKDYYAQGCPGYEGNCGLQLRDGRCALHAGLGEAALSALCRLYSAGDTHKGCLGVFPRKQPRRRIGDVPASRRAAGEELWDFIRL